MSGDDSRRSMRACIALLGIAFASVICGWPSVAKSEDKAKRVCTVAAMGDSLTDPKSHGGKFLDILREAFPKSHFDSYGKGGQMVNQMRKRFTRDILGDPPDVDRPKPAYTDVIVFGGVNDLYSDETAGRTVAKIEHDLSTMYSLAKGRGMRVVAIDVSPWGGFTKYWNERRAGTTRELDAWILAQVGEGKIDAAVDAFSLLSCGDPERLCESFTAPFKDGLHFNKAGHQKLGEALRDGAFADCL